MVYFADTLNWEVAYSLSYAFFIGLSLGVTMNSTELRPRLFRRREGDVLA